MHIYNFSTAYKLGDKSMQLPRDCFFFKLMLIKSSLVLFFTEHSDQKMVVKVFSQYKLGNLL